MDTLPQRPFRTDEWSMLTGTFINVYLMSSQLGASTALWAVYMSRLMLCHDNAFANTAPASQFPGWELSTADATSPIFSRSGTTWLVSVYSIKKKLLHGTKSKGPERPVIAFRRAADTTDDVTGSELYYMFTVKITVIYYQACISYVLFACEWNVTKTNSNVHSNVAGK